MKVATTPAQNSPCASAKTSTRMAPEHGRKPTATIAESPRFQPPGPASSSGSGAWACPQAEAWSSGHDGARGRRALVMIVIMMDVIVVE